MNTRDLIAALAGALIAIVTWIAIDVVYDHVKSNTETITVIKVLETENRVTREFMEKRLDSFEEKLDTLIAREASP